MFDRTRVTLWLAGVAMITGLSFFLTGTTLPPASAQTQAPTAAVDFTPDGKLKQPVGYRKWVHVGTPLTPKELNDDDVSEFHAVDMDPAGFAHYEKTGELRDGTVMIKEFAGVGLKEAISGKATSWASSRAWSVVKDSKRFKGRARQLGRHSTLAKYPLKAEVSKEAVDCATRAIRRTPGRTGLQPVLSRLGAAGLA